MKTRHIKWILAISILALLSACGGGGGGGGTAPASGGGGASTAPPAPSLSLDYQSVKAFHFTWADVSGETEYRLLENPDGISGYTQVATIDRKSTCLNSSHIPLSRMPSSA